MIACTLWVVVWLAWGLAMVCHIVLGVLAAELKTWVVIPLRQWLDR